MVLRAKRMNGAANDTLAFIVLYFRKEEQFRAKKLKVTWHWERKA